LHDRDGKHGDLVRNQGVCLVLTSDQDCLNSFSKAFRSFWRELARIGLPIRRGCRGRFKKTLLSHQT
jgi:hypothetical protein